MLSASLAHTCNSRPEKLESRFDLLDSVFLSRSFIRRGISRGGSIHGFSCVYISRWESFLRLISSQGKPEWWKSSYTLKGWIPRFFVFEDSLFGKHATPGCYISSQSPPSYRLLYTMCIDVTHGTGRGRRRRRRSGRRENEDEDKAKRTKKT